MSLSAIGPGRGMHVPTPERCARGFRRLRCGRTIPQESSRWGASTRRRDLSSTTSASSGVPTLCTVSIDNRGSGDRNASCDGVVKRSGDRFLELVKNTYRVLLSRGLKGCYVVFLDRETENFVRSRIETARVDVALKAAEQQAAYVDASRRRPIADPES